MYEPHYEEESGGGGFLIGLLCGTALGAAIGMMFAPKAGSEIRRTLYDSTGDIRRKAYETYGQATEQVNTMVAKGRQAVDRGREAFDSARQSAAGQGGGNGSTSEFTNRPGGVADFNSSRPGTTGGA
jgi:gas vesicle protein